MKTNPDEVSDPETDVLAKDFYAHIVAGKLDPQFLQALFGGNDTFDLKDSDIRRLAFLFQGRNRNPKRGPRNRGGK